MYSGLDPYTTVFTPAASLPDGPVIFAPAAALPENDPKTVFNFVQDTVVRDWPSFAPPKRTPSVSLPITAEQLGGKK